MSYVVPLVQMITYLAVDNATCINLIKKNFGAMIQIQLISGLGGLSLMASHD